MREHGKRILHGILGVFGDGLSDSISPRKRSNNRKAAIYRIGLMGWKRIVDGPEVDSSPSAPPCLAGSAVPAIFPGIFTRELLPIGIALYGAVWRLVCGTGELIAPRDPILHYLFLRKSPNMPDRTVKSSKPRRYGTLSRKACAPLVKYEVVAISPREACS